MIILEINAYHGDSSAAITRDSKIIGRFQGRMEWGSRISGNRSILADPHRENIRRRLKWERLYSGFIIIARKQ
jgi:predicted NodU family carbamoyl transferase